MVCSSNLYSQDVAPNSSTGSTASYIALLKTLTPIAVGAGLGGYAWWQHNNKRIAHNDEVIEQCTTRIENDCLKTANTAHIRTMKTMSRLVSDVYEDQENEASEYSEPVEGVDQPRQNINPFSMALNKLLLEEEDHTTINNTLQQMQTLKKGYHKSKQRTHLNSIMLSSPLIHKEIIHICANKQPKLVPNHDLYVICTRLQTRCTEDNTHRTSPSYRITHLLASAALGGFIGYSTAHCGHALHEVFSPSVVQQPRNIALLK